MALDSILGQGLASLTGNVENAIIEVHDCCKAMEKLKKSGADSLGISDETQLALINGRFGVGDEATKMALVEDGKDEKRIFRVQFNPSKLILNSRSDSESKTKSDLQRDDAKMLDVESASFNLTVELLFDDMHIYDSFMWDKINASALSMGTALAGAGVKALMKAKEPSVQPQVEALIGALRNPLTRLITFRWADFAFTGHLIALVGQYTMFSTSGRPVRAKVQLRLRHTPNTAEREDWKAYVKQGFSGDNSNLVGQEGSSIQNLLNLGF